MNFGLSSDAEILLLSTDSAYESRPNVQKRVCNVCTFRLIFHFAFHRWWLGRSPTGMLQLPHISPHTDVWDRRSRQRGEGGQTPRFTTAAWLLLCSQKIATISLKGPLPSPLLPPNILLPSFFPALSQCIVNEAVIVPQWNSDVMVGPDAVTY